MKNDITMTLYGKIIFNIVNQNIKKKIYYNTRFLKLLFLFLLISSCTDNKLTISIISDQQLGSTVEHGLSKLTDKLLALNIDYELVGSFEEAQGETVIVVGLAFGEGLAAQLLSKANRLVPEVPEALTIWNTERENTPVLVVGGYDDQGLDRKSTRLNSSHVAISYAVFCLKKKTDFTL